MSFGITGTCYAIATQLEAKKCGLLYEYDSESKLLSYDKVNSAYTTNTSLNKINGPSLGISITLNGKQGFAWNSNLGRYEGYIYAPISNNSVFNAPGFKYSCNSTVGFSVSSPVTLYWQFGFSTAGGSLDYALNSANAVNLTESDNGFTINFNNVATNVCPAILGYKYFVIRMHYFYSGSTLPISSTPNNGPNILITPNGKLMTGKTFQSYNITRDWYWRITENVTGKTNVNYIKYYYYHGGATNTAVGSMTQKLVAERGSSYFGDKVNVSKLITVSMPVNRFQILGITGTLASLPKSDRMVFHCGEARTSQTWTGSVIETAYTGVPLSTSFVNYASLGKSKTIVYGNDSADSPFYSRTFEECLDSLAGVGFHVT